MYKIYCNYWYKTAPTNSHHVTTERARLGTQQRTTSKLRGKECVQLAPLRIQPETDRIRALAQKPCDARLPAPHGRGARKAQRSLPQTGARARVVFPRPGIRGERPSNRARAAYAPARRASSRARARSMLSRTAGLSHSAGSSWSVANDGGSALSYDRPRT